MKIEIDMKDKEGELHLNAEGRLLFLFLNFTNKEPNFIKSKCKYMGMKITQYYKPKHIIEGEKNEKKENGIYTNDVLFKKDEKTCKKK
jgi:hypothetical protein